MGALGVYLLYWRVPWRAGGKELFVKKLTSGCSCALGMDRGLLYGVKFEVFCIGWVWMWYMRREDTV